MAAIIRTGPAWTECDESTMEVDAMKTKTKYAGKYRTVAKSNGRAAEPGEKTHRMWCEDCGWSALVDRQTNRICWDMDCPQCGREYIWGGPIGGNSA